LPSVDDGMDWVGCKNVGLGFQKVTHIHPGTATSERVNRPYRNSPRRTCESTITQHGR